VISGGPSDEAVIDELLARAAGHPTVLLHAGQVEPADVQVYLRAADVAVLPYVRTLNSGALLLALTAKHFSKRGAMLGLEFWQRFRKPVFADETIKLEWLIVRVTPNAKLQGDVVELRGRIKGADGQTAVGAKGRVLVTDAL
jgi:hypothetical protein